MWVAVVWALLKTALIGSVLVAGARIVSRRGSPALILVLAVAIVLRIGWWLAVRPVLAGDAQWFQDRAIDLATHFQYTLGGRPTARLAPGLPLLLAVPYSVFGPSPFIGLALNFALSIATVALVFSLARLLFNDRVAVVAASALAVWPGQVPYATVLLSEPLFGVLVLTALLLALEYGAGRRGPRALLLSGMICGAAALTRPVALLLPFLFGLLTASRPIDIRRPLAATVVMSLGLVLVVAPWQYRNYRAFGQWVTISTSSGLGLWQGNHETTTMLPSDAQIEPYEGLDEVERDRLAARDGKAFIAAHPFRALRFFVGKLYRTYETDTEVLQWSAKSGRPLPSWAVAAFDRAATTYFNAMLLLFSGFVAMPLALRAARVSSWAVVVLPVVYFAALQAVFISQYRYNYPSLPFVAIGASAFLCRVSDTIVSLRTAASPRPAAQSL